MIQDAWKNFEMSGKVTDYLAYRQGGKSREDAGLYKAALCLEKGMSGYGTEYSTDGNSFKNNSSGRV